MMLRLGWLAFAGLLFQDAAVREVKDVAYFEGEDADAKKNRLDLYVPKDKGKFPTVVWIHGGAWKSGDKALYGDFGRRFAEQGIGLAAISYRLSPAVKHPEHVKDCARAFAWVHANIGKHGGDPERLFVMGHSAGGHLSALLALDSTYLDDLKVPAGAVKGAIPMSGVYVVPAIDENARGPFKFLRDVFGSDPETCRAASPATHIEKLKAPMLVLTETKDTFFVRPSMMLFRAAAEAKGVKGIEFVDVQDRDHITLVMQMARAGEDPARARAVEFIRARCKALDSAK